MTVPSLILAGGDFELELSPEIGGAIVRFDYRGQRRAPPRARAAWPMCSTPRPSRWFPT